MTHRESATAPTPTHPLDDIVPSEIVAVLHLEDPIELPFTPERSVPA